MKIEVYSDTVCGWCFIGHQRLKKAIEKIKVNCEIVHIPFQLNPTMPLNGMDRNGYIEKKFGSKANAKPMYDHMVQEAKKENLNFNLELIKKTPSTVPSHILVAYMKKYNLQEKVLFDIFHNYFIDGIDIGDTTNLIKIAANHGIKSEELNNQFKLKDNITKIYQMDVAGREMGITGVPFFVFNNKVMLSGAQPVEVIIDAINKAK
jgi:predicted DsbA family dithiol-disulfide isomerase